MNVYFTMCWRIDKCHIPIKIEMTRLAESNSVKCVLIINNELEFLNLINLDLSSYDLSLLLELNDEPRSSNVVVEYL